MHALMLGLLLNAVATSASPGVKRKVFLLLSGELTIYRSIAGGEQSDGKSDVEVKEAVLQDSSRKTLAEVREFHPDVVVAIGDVAAHWTTDHDPGVPVIVSGVIAQSNLKQFSGMTGVSMDFPLMVYLQAAKKFLPEMNSVGVFVNPSRNPEWEAEATKAANRLALAADVEMVSEESDVGPALQKMNDHKTQIVLLTCDPLILNPESFKYLIQFTLTHGMGVIVPSSALLKIGGLLSVEADYQDLGRQTAALVKQFQATDPGNSKLEAPRRKVIGVNQKVAKQLGFQFSQSAIKEAAYEEK